MPADGSVVVHFPGPAITVCGRVVQRCLLCGAKLADSLNTAAPLGPDGKPEPFPTWPTDMLLEVEAGNPTRYSVIPEPADRRLPDNSCIDFA